MGTLARILVVGLMALCHGIANCAIVPVVNKQDPVHNHRQVQPANPSAIVTLSETIIVMPESPTTITVQQDPSHQVKTVQDVYPTTVTPLKSSSVRPTRAGEDTSRPPRIPPPTSLCNSPVMTEIPKDILKFSDALDLEERDLEGLDPDCLALLSQDLVSEDAELFPRDDYDDGYGYGYGSSTSHAVGGGYGSSPGPTGLPPGAYGGNPPAPAIVDPSIVTIPDPPTVTISLEHRTSSFIQSTPLTPHVVTVTKTATSSLVPQVPVQNVTKTVTASKSTLFPAVVVVTIPPPVKAGTTTKSEGYVYTTVSQSFSASHTSSSNIVIVQTPTAHPSPRPVTESAAKSSAKLNLHLMVVVAALAVMGSTMASLFSGLALLMASNNDEAYHHDTESGSATFGSSGSAGQVTDSKLDGTSDQHENMLSVQCGCRDRKVAKASILAEPTK